MKPWINMKNILFIGTFIVPLVGCCTYSKGSEKYECRTPEEVQAEGNDTWKILSIKSKDWPVHLEKDTFKNTPNLRKLLVWSASSMEQDTFNGLIKLDFLQINSLDLEELPIGILDNLPIRHLGLYKGTRRVPVGLIDHLPKLRTVLIDDNNIKEIKAGVFNNTSIQKLYLRNNDMETIASGAFKNMENMNKLGLTGNKLTAFDSASLLGQNSLDILWLGKNNFTKITANMFTNLPQLQQLHLHINQIESIEDRSFQSLINLIYLDLSNNNLKTINSNVFPKRGLRTLQTLLIHNNKLTFINNAVYLKTPNLKRISYGGNPLQCPCLEEAQRWTAQRDIERLCDDVYFTGERPACVYSDSSSTKHACINDVDLTEDLLLIYQQALADYPELNKKCDVSNGFDKAVLHDSGYW